MDDVRIAVEDALDKLVALVPDFVQQVAPPLDKKIAECLATYWFIATANDSIDDASAGQLAERIVPKVISKTWSSWRGDERAFMGRFSEMCQAMRVGKAAAMAIGAGSASLQDQRILFGMNVTKSALATCGLDDTDPSLVEPLMMKIGELHEKAWPIVCSAGRPKPMSPVAAQQETGCLLAIMACAAVVAGSAIVAGLVV